MIKKHPLISKNDFNDNIEDALKEFTIDGYVSLKVLESLYHLFAWYYKENSIKNVFENTEEADKLKNIINKFNLTSFKGDSLFYSSILLYNTLLKIINLRSFHISDEIKNLKDNYENKYFIEEDFKFDTLYNIYKETDLEISKSILLLSSIFTNSLEKEITNIHHYSQIINTNSIVDLVKPDIKAKLAIKNLRVNSLDNKKLNKNKKLIVIQDSTFSMEKNIKKLKILKAYILNISLINDYEVDWYFANTEIYKKYNYNKNNIQSVDIKFIFSGIEFDIINILDKNNFNKDKLLLITDGEDSFTTPFRLNIRELNLISFNENDALKINILRYGKFFKF